MIVSDIPPVPSISEELPAISFYEDQEGTYWVPTEVERDQRRAWQRTEATTGLALVPDDPPRAMASVSDCEVDHHCREGWSCDAHEGCPQEKCPEPETTDTWVFLNVDEGDEYRAGLFQVWAVLT